MKIIHGIAFLALALAAACSSVDDDTLLKDLDSAQIDDLCSEVKAETKDCGGGLSVTTDPSKCRTSAASVPDSCTATVGDLRSCNDGDPCQSLQNTGCLKIAQCSSGGS
jgi:hypothetical protein